MEAMKLGVLGTGMVGQTIGAKLCALGHQVRMGSRDARNEKAASFVAKAGPNASAGTFADAAAFGSIIFNCTSGSGTLEAVAAAGAENLKGKILIDVSNPLDFSQGMPPSLFTPPRDSLAEQIQRSLPNTKVVKALNTINCDVMVNPARVADGNHDVFVCSNDADAKAKVSDILRRWFGWKNVVDFGDLTGARATEAYVVFWVRAWGALGTADFNIKLLR